MKIKVCVVLLIALYLTACTAPSAEKYQTIIDSTTEGKVNQIFRSDIISYMEENHGEIISCVSSAFLGTPYKAGTPIGGVDIPEALVADFNGVDCFTLADYVEALARSHEQKTFLHNLIKTRYVDGKVNYLSRRHFFSDWFATEPRNARDVTSDISPTVIIAEKQLNRRPYGGEYVQGLGTYSRKISYIPGKAINKQVLNRLKTGDYVGVYSLLKGLDVSHIGIVVRHDGQIWFRNASSLASNRKVVDSQLMEYMHSKPGIVVLRAD
ncbi:MAG: DUF1460 domain-containing protein [Candidatus Malihini olakiniferum]